MGNPSVGGRAYSAIPEEQCLLARKTELSELTHHAEGSYECHKTGSNMFQTEQDLRSIVFRVIKAFGAASGMGLLHRDATANSLDRLPQVCHRNKLRYILYDESFKKNDGVRLTSSYEAHFIQSCDGSFAKCCPGESAEEGGLRTRKGVTSRTILATVTKPIEMFGSLKEFTQAMQDYFRTIITLREYGLEHRNISLENLSIGIKTGTGIITSFDETGDLREGLPKFIYTMPARHIEKDLEDNCWLDRFNSMESLFLCLIWIATTRSGPCNQKRQDSSTFRFRDTDIYNWNKGQGWNNKSGCLSDIGSEKRRVMRDTCRFEKRVLNFIHPFFQWLRPCLMTLRALIFDDNWEESRNELVSPPLRSYGGVLTGIFKELLEEAWECRRSTVDISLMKPARSDKNEQIASRVEYPSTSKVAKYTAGSAVCVDTYEHASPWRFIEGRRSIVASSCPTKLVVDRLATAGASLIDFRARMIERALLKDFLKDSIERAAALSTHMMRQDVHGTGMAIPSACLTSDKMTREEGLDSQRLLVVLIGKPSAKVEATCWNEMDVSS